MSRCIILTAYNPAGIRESIRLLEDDYIICADGGYAFCIKENIVPDVIIGDFDSWQGELPKSGQIVQYPKDKDDTDTLLCLKYGMKHGFSDFVIVGGMGGRLDHTIANLQCMSFAADHGKSVWMVEPCNAVTMISGGSVEINQKEGFKLSLLSFSEECRGVFAHGVKYPLENAVLHNSFPIGISNEFAESKAKITCLSGKLLICLSKDPV